jgi:predicted nuclease of restriction endonuclease-like (RecB) superfamily
LREIPWSAHLHILAKTKRLEEKEFYLRITIREKYSVRELERQLNSGLFERTLLADQKLPTSVRTLPQDVTGFFRDSYVLEFLNLPAPHSEKDLRQGLVRHLKNFLLEAGKGFAFVGESYRLQVGNTDFFIDLLLYHRMLQCLVAIELKVVAFEPAHLGQLNFYLEALDRDHRLPHENPSIGVLLCRDKDEEVVEYALSRNLSPALIAQYRLQLPDKKLLQARLHELLSRELPAADENV